MLKKFIPICSKFTSSVSACWWTEHYFPEWRHPHIYFSAVHCCILQSVQEQCSCSHPSRPRLLCKKIRIVIVKLWLKSGENWKWEISMVVNRENDIRRTSWNLMKTKRLNNHTKMCCSFLNFTRKWIEIFKALFHENGRGESIVYESYETNWAVTIHKIIKDSLPR